MMPRRSLATDCPWCPAKAGETCQRYEYDHPGRPREKGAERTAAPTQVAEQTCPKCEFEQKPCPGGAHAFALWEDGIRTVEDYAKMRAAQPVSAPSPVTGLVPLLENALRLLPWAESTMDAREAIHAALTRAKEDHCG
jgi:hypothetical protein